MAATNLGVLAAREEEGMFQGLVGSADGLSAEAIAGSRRSALLEMFIDCSALDGAGRGILCAPADKVSALEVNTMARHGRGLISAALSAERALMLGLASMPGSDMSSDRPRFLTSVESRDCTETGISAAERALTLRALGSPAATADDFLCPGHIQPMVASAGSGPWSGLPDLAFRHFSRAAGSVAAAWCDVLDAEGEVAGSDFCMDVATRLGIACRVRCGVGMIPLEDVENLTGASGLMVRPFGLNFEQFA